jgi:hypothetical protein
MNICLQVYDHPIPRYITSTVDTASFIKSRTTCAIKQVGGHKLLMEGLRLLTKGSQRFPGVGPHLHLLIDSQTATLQMRTVD